MLDDSKVSSVLIADGQSLSDSIYLQGLKPVGFLIPTSFDGSSLTFQVSKDNVTFLDLYTDLGTEDVVAVTKTTAPWINPIPRFLAWRYIKIRAGTSGSPTPQTGDTTITMLLTEI